MKMKGVMGERERKLCKKEEGKDALNSLNFLNLFFYLNFFFFLSPSLLSFSPSLYFSFRLEYRKCFVCVCGSFVVWFSFFFSFSLSRFHYLFFYFFLSLKVQKSVPGILESFLYEKRRKEEGGTVIKFSPHWSEKDNTDSETSTV